MTFHPGLPRPAGAGRKPGTPNRATADAKRIAEELGCDPFEILIRFAAGDAKGLGLKPYKDTSGKTVKPYVPLEYRLQAAQSAARFLYPQRKAVETDVHMHNPYDGWTEEQIEARRRELEAMLSDA